MEPRCELVSDLGEYNMLFGDSRFESSEFRRNRSGLDGMELLPDLFNWLEFNCEIAKCVSTVLDGDEL